MGRKNDYVPVCHLTYTTSSRCPYPVGWHPLYRSTPVPIPKKQEEFIIHLQATVTLEITRFLLESHPNQPVRRWKPFSYWVKVGRLCVGDCRCGWWWWAAASCIRPSEGYCLRRCCCFLLCKMGNPCCGRCCCWLDSCSYAPSSYLAHKSWTLRDRWSLVRTWCAISVGRTPPVSILCIQAS